MQISVEDELQRYSSGSKHNFCYTDEKIYLKYKHVANFFYSNL